MSPEPTFDATAPLVHHRGSEAFWIVFAILATLIIGPGMWFVLGRDKTLAAQEGKQDPPAHEDS